MKISDKLPGYALNFLLVLFTVMPVISRINLKYPDNERYYPFWATDLFAGFSSDVELYHIKIFEMNGKTFQDGIDSFVLRRTVDGFGFSASTSILALGRALDSGIPESIAKAKKQFEQNYLRHDKTCVYAIYKSSWNAVERWKSGKVSNERELARVEYKK